ncbi:MAG: hypothetical protein WCC03_15735 [Candidatus Acidiferrales bacterium]
MSRVLVLSLLSVTAWLHVAPCAFAQNPQDMMPAESAAKAKEILQLAIQALGGTAYLNLHDVTCEGRLSQFGHAGELNGFEKFADYTIPPFKDRTENLPKRNIIEVMNGEKGWTLDRGGVSEASGADMARFQEDTKKDLDYILRTRIKEPNMIFRYAGPDIVDLKEADWVELVDSDNRTIKIAFARGTHLPIRKIVDTRDANTRMKTDELEYYSNYHPINGIETPFQITRERNHIKIYQVFFDKCEYNTNLPESLFTKESLDERWEKVGKGARKKAEKDAKNN